MDNYTAKGIKLPKTKLGLVKMNKLLDAAEELFTSKGFHSTSISDICKRADTAVGTFYIYFDTKTDVYRYLMWKYERMIKELLAESIKNCKTRYEMEREGIKCFIRFALQTPTVYNVIWGSLSIDQNLFFDYYNSFSESYTKALKRSEDELCITDAKTVAYMLMGISNFVGLRAIFEQMDDGEIDRIVDETIMPALSNGIFENCEK
ncbi:MAG: TetR/AcrR family transcriptional regulator [Clostridia bacterium]|nr:TetR/AcrR family transcriptional regulator [Clostridia bacterium]MBR3845213.1 TetR/AcrR family transcriptional regulator [Clostridia bacterium]